MEPVHVKIKKIHPSAIIPKYQTDGAACFDLHVLFDTEDHEEYLTEWSSKSFRTGLTFEIPKDHVMLIYSRSGHGFKNDIRLSNCVGVIDSDYRGEIQIKLKCDDREAHFNGIRKPLLIKHGDRIAQAMIIKLPQVVLMEVVDEELSETNRGNGGFGSTGQ